MMDFILEAWVSSAIERSKVGWMLGKGNAWQPGDKLKLLFAGYNGTRNMGSDVRVEEMLRQLRHILGAELQALRGLFCGQLPGASARHFPPFPLR
jgi:hypothetical protein